MEPSFVIKAGELSAINYLPGDHPRPRRVEWINRGTDQVLRPTTIAMLLRTIFQPAKTPSVRRLHESSGLRIVFRSDDDRSAFAEAFEQAQESEHACKGAVETAIFESRTDAEAAIAALRQGGVAPSAISMMCRVSQFTDGAGQWPEGHSRSSVAGAVAGSGLAGALLGTALLFVPGVGQVAVAGAIAASAVSSVASMSGIIAATGGAIAKMLTDHDVDGVTASFYDQQIQRGKVFVSVETAGVEMRAMVAREILAEHGGYLPTGPSA